MRVVLATDHADLGPALRLYLAERRGAVVDVVEDVAALSSRVDRAPVDAAIVDSRLAGTLEPGVLAGLRARERPLPIVVLSTSRDQSRARAAGADAVAILGEPPDALLAALDRAVTRVSDGRRLGEETDAGQELPSG